MGKILQQKLWLGVNVCLTRKASSGLILAEIFLPSDEKISQNQTKAREGNDFKETFDVKG